MSVPTRQATPGPSATIPEPLGSQVLHSLPKKRSGSEVVEDTRDAKKAKVEGGPLSANTVNRKQKEKDKKKKKRKKKRRTSVVAAVLHPREREVSKPSSTVVLASIPTRKSPELVIEHAKSEAEDEVKSTSSDKGKGRAKSPSPPRRVTPPVSEQPVASGSGTSNTTVPSDQTSEINRLKEKLAAQSMLLERHQKHVSNHQQAVTCQICLDLMHKPYALIPCGHITCYGCLVRWFTATANPEVPGGANLPDTQNDSVETILNHPTARNGAYIRRRKNCPVCRAVVVQRPIEMWGIKGMVASLVKSGLVELPVPVEQPAEENADNDPWRNIFRRAGPANGHHHPRYFHPEPAAPPPNAEEDRAEMGWYDAEDGGIYRCTDCYHEILYGRCTGCPRVYQGHMHDDDDDEDDEDEDGITEAEFRGGIQNLMDRLMYGQRHDDEDSDSDDEDLHMLPDDLWPVDDEGSDHDDGDIHDDLELYRREMGMDEESDSDEEAAREDLLAFADRYFRNHAYPPMPPPRGQRGAARIEEVGSDGEEDDEEASDYEGSFIDDGVEHEDAESDDEVEIVDDDDGGSEGDDHVDALDRPPGERQDTPLRIRPYEGIFLHDHHADEADEEDDEDDEVEEVPPRRTRHMARYVMDEESDEEEQGEADHASDNQVYMGEEDGDDDGDDD